MSGVPKDIISQWFDNGIRDGAVHMLVVADEFNHEDYPVYVAQHGNVHWVITHHDGKNMQSVTEVYNLTKPKQSQLDRARCWDVTGAER